MSPTLEHVVAVDEALAKADAAAVRPSEWKPRPDPQSWWQTRQDRAALADRLLGQFTNPGVGRTRDKARRRGLTKLLD